MGKGMERVMGRDGTSVRQVLRPKPALRVELQSPTRSFSSLHGKIVGAHLRRPTAGPALFPGERGQTSPSCEVPPTML